MRRSLPLGLFLFACVFLAFAIHLARAGGPGSFAPVVIGLVGVAGAAIALGAIFLPSFLLLGGVLPLWSSIRRHGIVQAALAGVGAAVVGVLAAALWNPVLTTSIGGVRDVLFAAGLLVLLRVLPVWAVVPLAAAAGVLVF